VRRISFAAVLVLVAAVGGAFAFLNSVDVPDVERNIKTTSFVCLGDVADGECTAANSKAQFSEGGNKRIQIGIDEISPNLINAVVAAEDRSFFEHDGVDLFGIGRAAYRGIVGSASRQGASTITQQYVKMVYLSNERTYTRKLREAAIALKIERTMSKREILEAYLNEAPFGRGAVGIEAAARSYFDKDAGSLSISEAAYLVGLLRAPSYADEPTDPSKPDEATEAKRRRRTVLVGMRELGYITDEEFTAADAEAFEDHVLASAPSFDGTQVRADFESMGGRYIIDWVRKQLIEDETASMYLGSSALYGGGLRIYLTVDERLQYTAQLATQQVLTAYPGPSAALMSVDDHGQVKAMIGGQDHAASKVNLALGKAGGGSGRQPGSTAKMFALAAYVAAGHSVTSQFWSPPLIEYPNVLEGDKPYPVRNFNDEDLGLLTVREGTIHSANTMFIQIMEKIGVKAFAEMAKKLGLLEDPKPELGAVLGTSETSVYELLTAYSTIANGGERFRPHIIRRVEDADGNVLYDAATDAAYGPERVIEEGVAQTVAGVLKGVITGGTGKGAQIKAAAAGKTGTTDNSVDAWFAGFSCKVSTVVWLGFAESQTPMVDPSTGKGVTGGGLPAQMWKTYMNNAVDGQPGCDFPNVDYGTVVDPPDERFAPTTTTTAPPEIPPESAPVTTPGATVAAQPAAPAGESAGAATDP